MQNGKAFPSIHALLIDPFKTMWENDISKQHEDSIKKFTYIELVCNPKKSNPYAGYSEEDRPTKVKKEVFKDENYSIDSDIVLATMKYIELLNDASPTYGMYMAALAAGNRLKVFLSTLNPDEKNPNGTYMLKPAEINKAIKEIPDTMKSLEALRNKVNEELTDEVKTRKDRKIGRYEK